MSDIQVQPGIGAFSSPAANFSQIAAAQAQLNGKGRKNQRLPRSVEDLSKQQQVYIFNVGPWTQVQHAASLGTYYMAGCPEGKKYNDPIIVPGVPIEHYPDEGVNRLLMDENSTGWDLACQIVGIGPMLSPNNRLTQYGVFVSRQNPPSADDLAKANSELRNYYGVLVNEANAAYAHGPKMAEETIRGDRHLVAARALKKTVAECPWMDRSADLTQQRVECGGCGATVASHILRCTCGFVINPEKFKKAVADGRYAG